MIPTVPGTGTVAAVPDLRPQGAPSPAAPAAHAFGFLFRLPARALLALIWLYQRTLSPALPVLFGPSCGCRFYPSCSHYAAEAIDTHGALFGSWLAFRRLVKCTPLHPGGPDPVPARRCVRVAPALPQTLTPSQS